MIVVAKDVTPSRVAERARYQCGWARQRKDICVSDSAAQSRSGSHA